MAVRSFFNRMKFWKRTIDCGVTNQDLGSCSENFLVNRLKCYEQYLVSIQSIILWDSPAASILCILLVNIVFWVFVSLECRFYGILSSALLVLFAHDAWTQHIWPEISVTHPPPTADTHAPPHPSVLAVSRMLTSCCSHVRLYLVWLRSLRMQQPATFSLLCVLVCASLFVLGRSVSGLLLVYTLLMATMLGPGLYIHCVPAHLKTTLAQHILCVQQTFAKYYAEGSDDEYMPVTTSEDLALLTRVSDMNQDTYDSITNPGTSSDMAPDLAIPSYEEDSMGNVSDLELAENILPLDHNDDSDSNPDDMPIQSGHFNGGDSSSDDSDAFSKDLVFTETDERDAGTTAAARGLTSYISQAVASNMLGSVGLLANVIRSRQPTTRTCREPDSDSEDFEFINRDELNNQ